MQIVKQDGSNIGSEAGDSAGIRTPAGKAKWILSPSPQPLEHTVLQGLSNICSTRAGQPMLEAMSAMREFEQVRNWTWASGLALISRAQIPPPGLEPGSLGRELSILTG